LPVPTAKAKGSGTMAFPGNQNSEGKITRYKNAFMSLKAERKFESAKAEKD
jgi:hypothetical protein